MIRNCKAGQRVKIVKYHGLITRRNGKTIMSFDASRCDTGTVVKVDKTNYGGTHLYVNLDPPNFGEMLLLPKNVDKLAE